MTANVPECDIVSHDWKTVIFLNYGLGRQCRKCGKQVLDDNEDAEGY